MIARDILYYTLSVAVAAGLAMAIWFFVYIVRIMRSVQGLTEDFRHRLEAIDDILRTIKEKLTSTHVQLGLLAEGVKQLINMFQRRRTARRSSTRASNDGDDF